MSVTISVPLEGFRALFDLLRCLDSPKKWKQVSLLGVDIYSFTFTRYLPQCLVENPSFFSAWQPPEMR